MFLGRSSLGRHSEREATSRTGRVPARLVQDQNGGCAESLGIPTYPPCTACGLLEVCSRGRYHRYTGGFRGGLDSLPSIGGSTWFVVFSVLAHLLVRSIAQTSPKPS